jgi:hypothetical protein
MRVSTAGLVEEGLSCHGGLDFKRIKEYLLRAVRLDSQDWLPWPFF